MKKILVLLLVAVVSLSLFACGQTSESTSESQSQSQSQGGQQPVTYTVTFVQEGQDDVAFVVNEGEGIPSADVPTPAPVKGHTVEWSVTDFSEITENLTVTAIATPNTYTITYVVDAKYGVQAPQAQTVTYGTAYTLATIADGEYDFRGWELEGTAFENGTYNFDYNITVYAVFAPETNPY